MNNQNSTADILTTKINMMFLHLLTEMITASASALRDFAVHSLSFGSHSLSCSPAVLPFFRTFCGFCPESVWHFLSFCMHMSA